ncbi:MAG: DUF4249 domain-containing protein [Bacteroidetes bacterium]|nr:DUF4249 domain-containing protein [Bacteroidota bacterium]
MKKIIVSFIAFIALLTGCEEDINLSIIGGDRKIVIEGSIENGEVATVIVTRNSPLSQTVDFSKILVTDAQVFVSDGTVTEQLIFAVDSTASIPFIYEGNSIIGMPGKTYYLTVIADGQTFTATTTIPAPVALDSVWWIPQPPEDSLGFAWGHLSEPVGVGNAYRWLAKRATKDRRYIAPFGATFDDKYIDGKSFDFAYNRGDDPTVDPNITDSISKNEEGYFKNTDTIYVKFTTIDHNSAKFYTTFESALQSNGNPFASPVTVLSNIKGGALGVWAGFGVTYDTIMPTP